MGSRTSWRVESDGIPHNTKIFDGQGNQVPLDGIVSVRWEVDAGTHGRLTIVSEASILAAGEPVEEITP